jgi:hypothetical protein
MSQNYMQESCVKKARKYVYQALRFETRDDNKRSLYPKITKPKLKYLNYVKYVIKKQANGVYVYISPANNYSIRIDELLLTVRTWDEFTKPIIQKMSYLTSDSLSGSEPACDRVYNLFHLIDRGFSKLITHTLYFDVKKIHIRFVHQAFCIGLCSKQDAAITRFAQNQYFDYNVIPLILHHITPDDSVMILFK